MNHCPHCGLLLEDPGKTCDGCGTNLRDASAGPDAPACATCGSAVHRGWRHCTECGAETPRATRSTAARTTIAREAGSFTLDRDGTSAPPSPARRPEPEPLSEQLHR